MVHCLMCSCVIGDDDNHYHLDDMGIEITDTIESHIGHEIQSDGEICQECFATILQIVDASREIPVAHYEHVCIWCRSSLFRRRSHWIPDAVRHIVSNEISPRMVPEGALLCISCWHRVRSIARDQNVEYVEASSNTNICVRCELSLSRRRSHALPNGEERNYISNVISPRQIPTGGRVCWSCWQVAIRHTRRQGNQPRNCAWCSSSLSHRQLRLLGDGPEREELSTRIFPTEVPRNAYVCLGCWNTLQSNIGAHEENINNEFVPPPATMQFQDFKKTRTSGHHCFVPECTNTERQRVPDFLRKHIFLTKKVFVTLNSRVCEEHGAVYNWDILDQHDFSNVFNQTEIEQVFNLLATTDNVEYVPIDFEKLNNYSDTIVQYWTSVNKAQFFQILEAIPHLSETSNKPKTSLGVFLMKLRTGESHARIASILQISKPTLIKMLKNAREALNMQFVPLHLGLNHINRDELEQRNLLIPHGLFGDASNVKPIVICDGSYIYVQKSSNYLFQKKTYSLHKYRNLVKPFLIVACDGHIIDVRGPYAATDSDADIMKALFQDENGEYRNYFRENDIFILDRGFRDAIPLLESLNYKIFKPESVDQNETQLSTLKANQSRNVTLCRWVVEIVNGRFKRDYKLFRQEFFNLAAGHLFDDFRICAALINAFHITVQDRPDAQLILNRAQMRFYLINNLADYVIENNINRRRAHFVRIDGNNPQLDIFPQMTMSDLILFSLGTYQIKQARSYYGEHIRQNGSFVVEVSNQLEVANVQGSSHDNESLLLRARIKSRHQASKIYNTYILLGTQGETWEETIKEYYCTCICGKRTVGCCSHVMTIVWYLGWARHQDNIEPPASFLDNILVDEEM